jgi:hypothetical protein
VTKFKFYCKDLIPESIIQKTVDYFLVGGKGHLKFKGVISFISSSLTPFLPLLYAFHTIITLSLSSYILFPSLST